MIQAKKDKPVNQVAPPSAYHTRQVLGMIAPHGAVQAETQTIKRQKEKADLRNAIAFAAVSHACLESISDVSFELGVGKDNKVYVPPEVKQELAQLLTFSTPSLQMVVICTRPVK